MKKDQILNTARELFTRFGIRRVTVEELCAKANVSKGTFYKYFSNKNDLVIELLDIMFREGMSGYWKIMSGTKPFREKVRLIIRNKMEMTEGLSREFVKDIIENGNPEAVRFYHEKAAENIRAVTDDLAEAQRHGEIRRTVKPEFIFYIFNHVFDFITDSELEALYDTPGELIVELTNFFFYGIMPEEG